MCRPSVPDGDSAKIMHVTIINGMLPSTSCTSLKWRHRSRMDSSDATPIAPQTAKIDPTCSEQILSLSHHACQGGGGAQTAAGGGGGGGGREGLALPYVYVCVFCFFLSYVAAEIHFVF